MRCRACGGEMRLMQVTVGDTMRWAPPIERHIFKCAGCLHVVQHVVFGALPISTSGATTHPQSGAIRVRTQRLAEPQISCEAQQ